MPKSIIKSALASVDDSKRNYKRNKSVTFCIESTEPKKTKIKDDPPAPPTQEHREDKIRTKYMKNKIIKNDKDSIGRGPSTSEGRSTSGCSKKKRTSTKAASDLKERKPVDQEGCGKKCESTMKVNHNGKKVVPVDTQGVGANVEEQPNGRKREKRSPKTHADEPDKKISRQSSDEDLAEGLKNLNLDLPDGKTTAKHKPKRKRTKRKAPVAAPEPLQDNDFNLDNVVPMSKKRWNKDLRGAAALHELRCSVLVDNLPGATLSSYQRRLTHYFQACGPIKRFGAPEYYVADFGRLVFATTILFHSEEAATTALGRDNAFYAGAAMRVRRPPPPPPADTICVARCRADMTERQVREAFQQAGQMRAVRVHSRRRGGMAVAFIEFGDPAAVERALNLSVLINSKRVYVDRHQGYSIAELSSGSD